LTTHEQTHLQNRLFGTWADMLWTDKLALRLEHKYLAVSNGDKPPSLMLKYVIYTKKVLEQSAKEIGIKEMLCNDQKSGI
jgi:hypothetical protein